MGRGCETPLTDGLIERMCIIGVLLSMQFLYDFPTILELFDGPIILDSLRLPMFLGRISIRQILRRWGVNFSLRTTNSFRFRASDNRDRSGCPPSSGRNYLLSDSRSGHRRRDGDRRRYLLDNNGGFRFLKKQTNRQIKRRTPKNNQEDKLQEKVNF